MQAVAANNYFLRSVQSTVNRAAVNTQAKTKLCSGSLRNCNSTHCESNYLKYRFEL